MKYLFALGIFLCLTHGVGIVKTQKKAIEPKKPALAKPITISCSRCGYNQYNRSNMVLASRHSDVSLGRLSLKEEKCLLKIVQRESGGRVYAKNKRSSAYGLGQILRSTHKGINKSLKVRGRCPIPYSTLCASCQLEATRVYIKNRYGLPSKALRFWNRHHYY